jgi:hypothetical protein
MNEQEQKAIPSICLMASFADGRKDERERAQIKSILEGLAPGGASGLGGAAAGSAFSFATTYALGQVARQYSAGGRTIDGTRLRQMFASLLEQGKSLHTSYSAEIQEKARGIGMSQIAALVRQQ